MNKYINMSVADIIEDIAKALLDELEIPGPVTQSILTFAIDIVREDVSYYPNEVLNRIVNEPDTCSFCRTTAERLFNQLGNGSIDDECEFAGLGPPTEQRRQVSVLAVKMAGAIRASVIDEKREIYKIGYANHEFVVVIRNRRAEILQSFQALYGVGYGVELSRSFQDGELESCLEMMAGGGDAAARAQEVAFGKPLSADMQREVFAYKKANLLGDDPISERLTTHMRASLLYYKELAKNLLNDQRRANLSTMRADAS